MHLAEYEALRAEVIYRLGAEQRAEQAALGTIGAAVAIGATLLHVPEGLGVVMLIANSLLALLVFSYFTHRHKMSVAGAYLQTVLYPRIRACADAETLLRWEDFWILDPDRSRQRTGGSTLADTASILLFYEFLLLVGGVVVGPDHPLFWTLVVIGLALLFWGVWLAIATGQQHWRHVAQLESTLAHDRARSPQ